MANSRRKELSLAVLVAAIVAAGGAVPLYRHYHPEHAPAGNQVAKAPAPAAPRAPPGPAAGRAAPAAPAPGTAASGTAEPEAESAAPPAPPGTEVVPAEEAENGT